jgi:spiro-SPASM protein
MSLDQYRRLADAFAEFAGDAVVNLSLGGEPATHAHLSEFVEATLRHERLQVLIETSGIGWREEVLVALGRLPQDRMIWIVDLDAASKELYESLRGSGWDEAQVTCSRLVELFPGRVHVQAVRMQENEADLESFYRYWKERVSNVIIQKYDWYCGYLPQKKVTDLSPLHRLPCSHIKRDMIILVDGSVPMCREDLLGKYLLGNAFSESLADIWAKGEPYYLSHIRNEYPELCKRCDEYYTYNF